MGRPSLSAWRVHLQSSRFAGLLVVILALRSEAHSTGSPDARTSAPGELSCIECHYDPRKVVSGPGSFVLDGPVQYTAGAFLRLRLLLESPGQRRWGFQLTVLDDANLPVGTIIQADAERTQLTRAATGRQYLTHTGPGNDGGVPDVAPGWEFVWNAPPAGSGPVTFYASAIAANDDGRPTDDIAFGGLLRIAEMPTGINATTWSAIRNLYR